MASTFWLGVPDESGTKQFNGLYNDALKEEWWDIFEEARLEVHNARNTTEWTKTTEAIHKNGNTFCQWLFGDCDENSLYARFVDWCASARDEAIKKMDSNFVKNNTQLLITSYTTCYDLAGDVTNVYKDAANIGIAKWNKEQIVESQEKFIEKSQDNFQEKVSGPWDVFKKKLTNFVRSVQWFTKNVFK